MRGTEKPAVVTARGASSLAETLDPKHNFLTEELVAVQPSRDADDDIRIVKTLGERKGYKAQVAFRVVFR